MARRAKLVSNTGKKSTAELLYWLDNLPIFNRFKFSPIAKAKMQQWVLSGRADLDPEVEAQLLVGDDGTK